MSVVLMSRTDRENQQEQTTLTNWITVRATMPAYNPIMFRFAKGKTPIIVLNTQRPMGAFDGSEGHGRVSAGYRQLVRWGFTEAKIYDCSQVQPESVNRAILDGATPGECVNCPLAYNRDSTTFCPARIALKAYQLRKQLELAEFNFTEN